MEHLGNIFERKIIQLEERLEKNLENKVKNMVEHVLEDSINHLDQKITNIENTLSMSYATNTQKVFDWINNLSEYIVSGIRSLSRALYNIFIFYYSVIIKYLCYIII